MNLDRVLIIGGSGMVGSEVNFGIKPNRTQLDYTNAESVTKGFEMYQPEVVINLAGLVDVKTCEENPEEAQRVNVGGAHNLARECAQRKIFLVHFSTCMVFDGKKVTPYEENDVPHPLTVYGKTKYESERIVLDTAPRSLIVRTGWLFGSFGRNTKFARRFYDALSRGSDVLATSDRVGSPTYVPDLIGAVVRLLSSGMTGIAHVVNDGIASYFDVAQQIKVFTRSQAAVSAIYQKDIAPGEPSRGHMEALTSNRNIKLRPYTEALAEYVEKIKQ